MTTTMADPTPYVPQHQMLPQHTTSPETLSSEAASAARKRVRTGCLNCRRKHKKCDEHKPVCHGCVSKNEVCEWPVPKLKKTSRRNSLQQYSPLTPLAPQNSQQQQLPSTHYTLPQIGSNYTSQPFPVQPPAPLANARPLGTPFSQFQQSSYPVPPNQSRRLSSDLFSYSLAQSASTSALLPSDTQSVYSTSSAKDELLKYSPRNYQLSSDLPLMRSDSVEQVTNTGLSQNDLFQLGEMAKKLEDHLKTRLPAQTIATPLNLRDEEQLLLMQEYLTNIGPTLDVDEKCLFVEELPLLMKYDPSLMYSVYAFASLSLTSTTTSSLTFFKHALEHYILPIASKEASVSRDAALLFLTLFLYQHSLHSPIVHHLASTYIPIQFHFTILRLTVSQILIPDSSTTQEQHPYSILPFLSTHQQDFLTSFTKATSLHTTLPTLLHFETSPFPTILTPSPRTTQTHLLLNTSLVLLLTHKPMDVKVRSHPVAHYAKRACGALSTLKGRRPWYSDWCLFTVGKVFTHESEHAAVIGLMEMDAWKRKIRDYWEGRGDV